MQRLLAKDTILVVDAMNYIKGFRYQMFCAAKEAGVRVCTVRFGACDASQLGEIAQIFVAAPPDKCREWHAARDEADKYDDAA